MEQTDESVSIRKYYDSVMDRYRKFCDLLNPPDFEKDYSSFRGIPHPFSAMIGKGYVDSATRLFFIGKETKRFDPEMPEFLQKIQDGTFSHETFSKAFQNLEYLKWMGDRKPEWSFWWFVISVLAKLKKIAIDDLVRRHDPILSSFGWGNALAVESLRSKGVKMPNMDRYNLVSSSAEHANVNKYELIDRCLRPDIIVVSCARKLANRYFSEFNLIRKKMEDRYAQAFSYEKNDRRSLVIMTTHPRKMAMQRITQQCASEIATKLQSLGWKE